MPANNPQLSKLVEQLVNRMLGQLRQNFSKLNSINNNEIERLYQVANTSPEEFKDIVKEYPGGGYVMSDPLYTLLTLIAIKFYTELSDRDSQNASMLLSLVMLARLKYKYIRICDPDIIKIAFSLMSKKTYVGTGGLIWGIYKISSETFNKYKDIMSKKPNDMYYRYRYIIDIRNKFNQLMKHIAQMYYWVIINKDNIYSKEKIASMASSITNYVATKDLNQNLLQLIATMSKVDISVIYEFQHHLQIDDEFQNAVNQIFTVMVDKMVAIKKFDKAEKTDIDFTSMDFLKEFYANSRRSSTLLSLARISIFADNGFDSNLVLAFCSAIMIMWESIDKDAKVEDQPIGTSDQPDNYNNDYNSLYDEFGYDRLDFPSMELEENFSELVTLIED